MRAEPAGVIANRKLMSTVNSLARVLVSAQKPAIWVPDACGRVVSDLVTLGQEINLSSLLAGMHE